MRRAQADRGQRRDLLTSEERQRLRELERENRELNPILLLVERPIVSRPPDDPSGATGLRDRPANLNSRPVSAGPGSGAGVPA